MKRILMVVMLVGLLMGSSVSYAINRFVTEDAILRYLESEDNSSTVEVPWWTTRVGIYVPTIDTGTMDFYMYRLPVDGTGSPRHNNARFSFHCDPDGTDVTSATETGSYGFTVNFSTVAQDMTVAGQGSKAYTINSSSTTVYHLYVATSVTNYANAFDVGTGDFSIGLSFKHDTATNEIDGFMAYITTQCALSADGNVVGYRVEMAADGDVQFVISNTTGTDTAITTAATYDDNVWHRLWCVKEDSTMTIYIDGSAVSGATRAVSGIGSGTLNARTVLDQYFYVGKSSTTTTSEVCKAFTGSLDGVTLYKTARTAIEIKEDYDMFNESQYAVVLQDAKGSDNQISSGTGLFYLDLTDETQAWLGYIGIVYGGNQTANRTVKFFFKEE